MPLHLELEASLWLGRGAIVEKVVHGDLIV